MAKVVMLFLTLVGVSATSTQSVAAVQKVIQMLQDMSATNKQEKKAEEVAFAEFNTWCTMQSAELKTGIAKHGQEIESLTAEIGQLTSDVAGLGDAIAGLQSDITTHEADKKGATVQRDTDHAEFLKESKDYAESVDALDRAIAVLQKQDYDRTGAETALLQVSEKVPDEAKSVISAFLGMMKSSSPDGTAYDAPEANAYEFQSGSIVQLLKRLQSEFTEKLGDCQKEEMNSKHASDMILQDLTDSVEFATKDVSEKSIDKERKASHAALSKKQLANSIDVKAADEKTLSDMTVECKEKKLSFDEKQQLRADELEALAKAIEILQSTDVTGNAEKHLALAQGAKKGTSFVFLRSDHAAERSAGIRREVRELLAAAGVRLNSESLTLLAQRASVDPFKKVKSMIDGMITRLLNEANEDATHEGYCTKEMGESKITRNKLSEEIDGLSAAAEEGKAMIMQLTDEIATLSKEVAELDESRAEATKMRLDEKATNKATVADAKAGQSAVDAATKVLKEFYAKASTATGFLQVPGDDPVHPVKMGSEEWNSMANPNFDGQVDWGHKEGMQTFGDTYTGQQDEAGGVMALLEVIQSDFATLQADTEASEAANQRAYDEFMVETQKNKAVKSRKTEMNSADKASAESKLRDDISDMKFTQDKLLAADRYHAKLVPQCIDKGMTFEEHQAARQEEIKSLKEALTILSREDVDTSAF